MVQKSHRLDGGFLPCKYWDFNYLSFQLPFPPSTGEFLPGFLVAINDVSPNLHPTGAHRWEFPGMALRAAM